MDQKAFETQSTEIEHKLGIVIPVAYQDFLLQNHPMIFDDGILYTVTEIVERYQTLEFARYAPDLIPIGNDNGDYELVMRSGRKIKRFGFLEQGAIGTQEPTHLQNFAQWYANGHSFAVEFVKNEVDWSKIVKVVLKKCPANKAKTMMQIRKALSLDTPVSELLQIADKAPIVLTNALTYAKAKKCIDEASLEEWLDIK